MRTSRILLVAALLYTPLTGSAFTGTDAVQGSIRGTVTDTTDGVLPGVTVVATSASGQPLATATTDESGAYVFTSLPPGIVQLEFTLDGFSSEAIQVSVQAGAETRVIRRLGLAPRNETVTVVGRIPEPPSLLQRVIPPPPAPVLKPIPEHDPESICGPAKPGLLPESLGTIHTRQDGDERGLYAKDDVLVIEGGTSDGLDVGRNLVARRFYPTTDAAGLPATGEHTAGLVQILTADEHSSTAIVVYACDELMRGDFLAPFQPEPVHSLDPIGVPDYTAPARILFADAGQMMGAPRRMMVIDRGTTGGIRAGQRLTLFRTQSHARRSVVGDAVVVAVRPDSATIRVENVTDAIEAGDWAARQRTSAPAVASASSRRP